MAPLHTKIVSLILLLLLIFISGGAVILLYTGSNTHWQSWGQLIAQIIGGIIGFFESQKKDAK
jgi:uncharacterized membrane protein HdeD (DUF308 family)